MVTGGHVSTADLKCSKFPVAPRNTTIVYDPSDWISTSEPERFCAKYFQHTVVRLCSTDKCPYSAIHTAERQRRWPTRATVIGTCPVRVFTLSGREKDIAGVPEYGR